MSKILKALLLCGIASQTVIAATAGSPVLEGAWIRALPPGQANTAAYLTVSNPSDAAVIIVGGSTDIARAVEIHTSREVDGLQRMEQLAEVRLAPGESVEFMPGGLHLMLLDLQRMPAPGEEVGLCLALESGEQVCTTAQVRKSAGGGHAHGHH